MEQAPITYRAAEGREREIFAQYLLPVAADLARRDRDHILLLGQSGGKPPAARRPCGWCGRTRTSLWRRSC